MHVRVLYRKVPTKLRRKLDCDQQHSVLASESGSLSEAGMTRAVALLSSLLLAATLGAAQDRSTSGATSGQTNSSPPNQSQSTIRGCVSSSSLGDDHFTLTEDQTGTVFVLSGMAEQIRAQVGHQVEVSGEDSLAVRAEAPLAERIVTRLVANRVRLVHSTIFMTWITIYRAVKGRWTIR